MPSTLLQVVNSLFQTCYNSWEQAVRTQFATTCEVVNRFVTYNMLTLQTYTKLWVFTYCVHGYICGEVGIEHNDGYMTIILATIS
jgi:hypothetical protein